MADPVKSEKFTVPALLGLINTHTLIEPSAEEGEALSLNLGNVDDYPEWTYATSTEDNGTAGIFDLEPGLTYNGPQGMYVQVSIRDLDLNAALNAGTPEGTDTVDVQVFVNSTVVSGSDEGATAELDALTVEYNLDVLVGPLNEGDVLRVAVVNAGEEADADTANTNPAVITIR